MSLLEKMAAANNPGTAMARQAQTKAATSTQAQAQEQTETFEITEAEIKQNPAYLIATDTQKSEEQRVKELIALKAYNAEKTEEENAKNLQAYNQFLLYCENQILSVTKKSTDFTNDEAFSMYDDAVRTLQSDLGTFKGQLVPMVKALEVLQKARDQKVPAGAMLKAVQDLKDGKAKVSADIQAKKDQLAQSVKDRAPIEAEATAQIDRLTQLDKAIEDAKKAKLEAEGILEAQKAKYMWQRSKQVSNEAIAIIATSNEVIKTSTQSKETLSETAKVTASKLERHNEGIAALEAEIKGLEEKATEIDNELTGDEDTAAISKLLEITGKDYKTNRIGLTDTVKGLLDNSVTSFEKTMSRFKSGGEEVAAMRSTVTNVGGWIDVCARADAKVRVIDADYIADKQDTVKRIQEEKGAEAAYDPDYEQAKAQLGAATTHSKESLTLSGRTGELSEKLTRQLGTYTGLQDAFRQKFMDAQRLRTNAAVEVSSKLLTTTKSLELAIASENTNTVDDMLADLSETTNKATTDLFNTLSQAKGEENDRLALALKQAIDTGAAIDAITKDLREKTKEGIVTREAMRQVREELGSLTEGLAAVPTNAERDVQKQGLQKAGEEAALRAAGVTLPKP